MSKFDVIRPSNFYKVLKTSVDVPSSLNSFPSLKCHNVTRFLPFFVLTPVSVTVSHRIFFIFLSDLDLLRFDRLYVRSNFLIQIK